MRPDENSSNLVTIYSKEVFGHIRSMDTFRLPGMTKDFVVIGSDSGRIVLLDFNEEINDFEKIH